MLTYFLTKNETRSPLNITIWNNMLRPKIDFKSFDLKLRYPIPINKKRK